MTILSPVVIAGTMEKFTDPVTSDSELEEGEIANDEIEIISEFIRHPPQKSSHQNSRDESGKSLVSTRKSDSSTETRLRKGKPSGSGSGASSGGTGGTGGKTDSKRVSDLKLVHKASTSEKASISLKRNSPPKTVKRLGASRSIPKPDISRSSRNRVSSISSRSNRERGSSTQAKKEDKQAGNSLTQNSAASKDTKWKQSFELVTPGSVESMDIDSASESDEEIKLRLEALNSVVVNVKPKEDSNSDVVPSISNSTPEPLVTNGVQEDEEEDEDEELLRAQLLIEVARKQTKELEVQMQPEPKDVKADEVVQPVVERRTQATKIAQKPIHIPKADRLVIDLRNDSSDSSDEEDRVEVSITALLKTARQTVEEKVSVIPHALSHLPRNQQEEYQRLKQEIVRRENRLMKQGTSKGSTLVQSQSDNLPKNDSPPGTCIGQVVLQELKVDSTVSDKTCHVPQVDQQAETLPKPSLDVVVPRKPSPVIHPALPVLTNNNAKENEQEVSGTLNKSDGAAVSRQTTVSAPRVADSSKNSSRSPVKSSDPNSPKLSALKQQLLLKRRDLASTKEALKSQLGLVDQNRLLLEKSSQEVKRLKAMLQAAEDTERQLRTQLTNSQLQTQRLKTKMQSVERQVTVLHSGIGAHRIRRVSTKLRPKLANSAESNNPAAGVILPSLTPLRVKPRVFAKALAKNNFTYRRPTTAIADSVIPNPEDVQMLIKKKFSEALGGKKTLHNEQWLYGTLGDEWMDSDTVSNFPTWSPHGHASRFLSSGTDLQL